MRGFHLLLKCEPDAIDGSHRMRSLGVNRFDCWVNPEACHSTHTHVHLSSSDSGYHAAYQEIAVIWSPVLTPFVKSYIKSPFAGVVPL